MYSFVLEELIIRPLVLSNGINDLFTKTIRIETVNDFFKIMALFMIFHDIEKHDNRMINQDDLADWVSWLRYPSPQYWTSHPILERELGPVIIIKIFDVDVVLIAAQQ